MSKKFIKDRLPKPGDLCAVAPISMLRVASMLFDKIHVATHDSSPKADSPLYGVPEEVTFGMRSLKYGSSKRLEERFETIYDRFKNLDVKTIVASDDFRNQSVASAARCIAEECIEQGVQATPLYPSDSAFSADFPEGEIVTYQAAINNLPIVADDSLTWDEVLDFRRDSEAISKYRALRLWLSDGLKAKTLSQAQDLIAKRIEEYEWAIRKHGLKSATGAISQVLSAKSITALGAGTLVSGIFGGPIWSTVTAGLLVGANICVWMAERKIEREALSRERFADVALLYEAKQLLLKKKSSNKPMQPTARGGG